MALQYISDNLSVHTAVVIPINDWNKITAKHRDLKEVLEGGGPENGNASRFKGLLTSEEVEKYDEYLKQARNEWDRDI